MRTPRPALITLATAALLLAAAPAMAAETVYKAELTGAAEVPDPVDTKATGLLELKLSADGSRIDYVLTVTDLVNVSGADIHLGPANARGPLVVKMFPKGGAAPKKGAFSGVLAQGTIKAGDLQGSLTGSPLSELIDEIRQGNTYSNVHTDDGVAPANTGAGDHPVGEIRGQIK